ncbi:MaoC/PaaZ C-terminal domain-containing protein [Thermodesulfobacteriota bacterium]
MAARRYFEDYEIGEVFKGANGGEGHTVTEADIAIYAATAADNAAIHLNEEFSKKSVWKTRIAQGVLNFAISEGLLMRTSIFETIDEALFVSIKDVRYLNPVLIGDTLTADFEVLDKQPDPERPGYGIIALSRVVKNQRGETVLTGETASRVRMKSHKR